MSRVSLADRPRSPSTDSCIDPEAVPSLCRRAIHFNETYSSRIITLSIFHPTRSRDRLDGKHAVIFGVQGEWHPPRVLVHWHERDKEAVVQGTRT